MVSSAILNSSLTLSDAILRTLRFDRAIEPSSINGLDDNLYLISFTLFVGCICSMLTIVFAESAIERVPEALWSHPSVVKSAHRVGKRPGQVLLDRSYHHAAMVKLENAEKRGRPDIIHFGLLESLGTPLNREGLLKVYVHTIDDYVMILDPKTRLPKNYNRFVGLIEQLYETGRVPSSGRALIELEKKDFPSLIEERNPTKVIALTRVGEPKTLKEVADGLSLEERPVAVMGGFPHGHFTERILRAADELVSIDPDALEASVVASRLIYAFERAIGLPEKRIGRPFKGA